MWSALGSWWSGVELWLTQLPFPAQFALVMVVLLPLCLGVVMAVDRLVDFAAVRIRWRPVEEHREPSRPGRERS